MCYFAHMCFLPVAVDPVPSFTAKGRGYVAEDGAKKDFSVFEMLAFLESGVIVVCNGTLFLTQ